MEQNSNSEWVAGRLALVKPTWQPNADRARTQLRARPEQPFGRRRWIAAAATVAFILVVLAAVPQSRAVAQDLWYRMFFVRRFEAVRLDLSRIPLKASITSNGLAQKFATLEEAERKAGFRPMVPPPDVAGRSQGEFAVTGPIGVRQVVDLPALRAALDQAGAREVQLPAEWHGVTLRMDLGPMVFSGYEGEIQIVQARPIELHVPSGFPLAKFAETAFRCAGIPEWQARAMGEKFARSPAWLLDLPDDEVGHIEEIALRVGSGLLVEDTLEGGGSRATIMFGTAERIFAISSPSGQLSIRIANSLL